VNRVLGALGIGQRDAAAAPSRAGRAIAVVNQKGGVGKTTTAVNLGASLALAGQRVLVVDSDPQGNTTTGLGVDKADVERCTYTVIVEGAAIADAVRRTEIEGLDVLPATLALASAEIDLVPLEEREMRLKHALELVAASYDYILVDCPPSLGLLTVNALTAVAEVIIPVQAEYYALEGLSQLTTIVERIKQALNPKLAIMGVLVTMYDGRTKLAVEVLDEIHRFFPGRVFRTLIPRNIRLSEAPSFGKPVALFDPKSRGAKAYQELANEVLTAAKGAR